MLELDQRLRAIADHRARCTEAEDGLYRARLELTTVNKQLRWAKDGMTVGVAEQRERADAIRGRLGQAQAGLSKARETLRDTDAALARLDAQEQLTERLAGFIGVADRRDQALDARLADLRAAPVPPRDEVLRLEAELRQLGRERQNLKASAMAAAEELTRQRAQREGLDSRRAAAVGDIERRRRSLEALQADLAGLLAPGFRDSEALHGRRRELEAAVASLEAGVERCRAGLGELIGGLYEDPHPRRTLGLLDDAIPFLLFPVRLETIFAPTEQGVELRVRVYPDEILLHTHEDALTDVEVAAGELYWTELVVAGHLRTEQDRRRRAAWRHIVEQLSGPRAAWVARQTKPADWDAQTADGARRSLVAFLDAAGPSFFSGLLALPLSDTARTALQKAIDDDDGDAFIRMAEQQDWGARVNAATLALIMGFPTFDLTKTDAWTRAPRTRMLPDRFVLLLYATVGEPPREIVGRQIPDLMTLGPDPLASQTAFPEEDQRLTFGPGFDWMSDFDKAVDQGMGFRVPLTPQAAQAGFARICVLGLKLSAAADEAAVMVETLIDNHQFSPRGFSLAPQGTATNNTERDGSGYSDNDRYDDLAFLTDADPPAFDPFDPDPRKSQTDGRQLADLLGIAYGPLQTVRHADRTDLLEATAMNKALFPATLGYWLGTWMAPVVTPQTARLTRDFFTRFVTGRGPAPAIRVGDQPYGVLVTSDLSRWRYPERGASPIFPRLLDGQEPFLAKLRELLGRLDATWKGLAADLPFAGKAGTDPSAVLMNVLGLQPTSVEFFQRIGFNAEYLRNRENFKGKGAYANELESLIGSMPATASLYLAALGLPADTGDVATMRSLHVLWQHYVSHLDAPNLVESRPPSETEPLSPNYVDWLASAEGFEKIAAEAFGGEPPNALLYLMLRNAVLLQLHRGAYDWLETQSTFEAPLVKALRETSLPGVRAGAPTLSKYELMGAKVSTVQPEHALASMSVADLIWRGYDGADLEASFLADQKAALKFLAPTKTASLERAFVEHLDCCHYRLDAWITGLFTQRLATQRGFGSDNRRTGVYLGAFGWVEDLKPAQKTLLQPGDLPQSLRPKNPGPILAEDDVAPRRDQPVGARRGGFMHAPSINHASAAALLRSAYLSHADPDKAEMFAVNLSSERVRRAEFVLQGMRNGQPVEALLGYQFEKGLHNRTSASIARGDAPVLELNQFIESYRTAFPFEAREVVQAGTGPAGPTMPAYSVVNGLALSAAALSPSNGYALGAVLPAAELPDASQGAAILAERDALLNTLDAVKDLLTAENAYQLVQGNFDRVAAVSLAQKDARIPPSLQVTETPRGAAFTFTNRVTLHFDDLDPALAASNPWPGVALTPAARMEPGLNHWLGSVLAMQPDKVVCVVSTKADSVGQRITLAELGLQPIDFVRLAGVPADGGGGAAELETRVAHRFRQAHGADEAEIVQIVFAPSVAASERTFGRCLALARQLQPIIAQGRPANAGDFLPAAGGKENATFLDKTNPEGFDTAELRGRVQAALSTLENLADALDGAAAPNLQLLFHNDPDDATDDVAFTGQLGAAFGELEAAKLSFTDVQRVETDILASDAEAVAATLRGIAAFGISDAFPPEADLSGAAARSRVLARAHRIARRLRRSDSADSLLQQASTRLSEASADRPVVEQVRRLLEAGGLVFDGSFRILPVFHYWNDAELALADATRTQLLSHPLSLIPGQTAEELVDEWLLPLARVRPALHRWEVVRVLADALDGAPLGLLPVQLPFRAKDSWLAVEFPEADPLDPSKPFGVNRDTLSIIAHGASAFRPGARQRAILLDEWTEEIPTDQETTGISFHFNQPNAEPPQTLLVAVTPDQTGSWTWDDLVGMLTDTLGRAKRRAVEPAQLESQGPVWNAFAPALVSEFSTLPSADVSLDLLRMQAFVGLTEFYRAIETD